MGEILIRNALIVDANEPPRLANVLVRGSQIAAVTDPALSQDEPEIVLDASGAPTIAGLCNSHLHSNELLMKGSAFGLPLEQYILRTWPRFEASQLPTPEEIYACTIVNCADMIRGGITSAVDDVVHFRLTDEYVDAVLQAYADSGMRASVSIALMDKPLIEHLPIKVGALSPAASEIAHGRSSTPDADLAFCRRQIERWREKGASVRIMTSPSAPQRCTDGMLRRIGDLAREFDVPFHVHVQESLIQAASGPLFYGMSMVQYLAKLGVLNHRTTIAHGVWLDDHDIELIATAGATVVHNPSSNLKLGSGIARVWALRSAGVNVALGTDANTCNDSQDLFEAMKLTSLLSSVSTWDYSQWLGPGDALEMATIGGAKAGGWPGLGRIVAGAPADIVIMNPRALAFLPLNDPLAQVVFAARSSDVATVIGQGRVLMRDGTLTTVDVDRFRGQIEESARRFWDGARSSLDENASLMPAFDSVYRGSARRLRGREPYRLLGTPAAVDQDPRVPRSEGGL